MKQWVMGILAHVDAGKTTLSEAMLYSQGNVRNMGRVDKGDTLLDTHFIERKRGITIFAKQAVLELENAKITLLDTPGHVDFSAEAERTLQVLDCAVLVVSASSGVQSHTATLWQLLQRYNIPTFIFVNKMDQQGADKIAVLNDIKSKLSTACIDFSEEFTESTNEELALCDEALLKQLLENEKLHESTIAKAVTQRKIFPCYFGTALHNKGVDALLKGIETYFLPPAKGEEFGARIFKIGEDAQGARLTYLKVTSGELKVKTILNGTMANGESWQQKADQLRIYHGEKFKAIDTATQGTVCCVTGLSHTRAGETLGVAQRHFSPMLSPVLTYSMEFPIGTDINNALQKLRILQEEDPELHVTWNENTKDISVQMMGQVQIEVLQSVLENRFGIIAKFGKGTIVYKETITAPVEGIGHFEPLRHYAEVHLWLEPLSQGSGLQFATDCRTEMLDKNWQSLVLNHLKEKEHLGVLTKSPITDMKITLIAGRAHLKHTEGGDFRNATYRAIRHGLKNAQSVLLEPVYNFTLTVPEQNIGRAMADLQRMHGEFSPPEIENENATLTGTVPASTSCEYQREIIQYTKGAGKWNCTLKGYFPCHNPQEVIETINYDSELDSENTADSVFCSHGAGYVVKWYDVKKHAHVNSGWQSSVDAIDEDMLSADITPKPRPKSNSSSLASDKELMEIYERTYGKIKRDERYTVRREPKTESDEINKALSKVKVPKFDGEHYLLVDGYNVIFAWDELNQLAKTNLELARKKFIDILCNYRGVTKSEIILVFDAYKVKGHTGDVEKVNNINVVYTKEAETADMYIEKVTKQLGKKHRVRVVTSDYLEQLIILGHGGLRVSASAFKEEVAIAEKSIREFLT